jgi:hypothetical protein
MAHVSQELKAKLVPGIKAVLNKYGMKGTVSVRHHSALVVTIASGKLDVIGNWFEKAKENPRYQVEKVPESLDVNIYWIDDNYTGIVKKFLNELIAAIKSDEWFDKSDIQSDYFHTAYYIDVNIGKWNKPYQLVS